MNTTYDMPMHGSSELPNLSFRQSDLPEILRWQVDGDYYLVLKVKMTGLNNMTYLPDPADKVKKEADFKILSVKSLGNEQVSAPAMDAMEFKERSVKAKSGGY